MRFGTLLLISIVLAKTHFSNHDIGIYESFLFITGAVTFFWINGLIQTFLPLSKASNTFNDSENNPIIFNTFILLLLFSLGAAGVIYLFKNTVLSYFGSVQSFELLFLLVVAVVLGGPTLLTEYIFLVRNKPKQLIIFGVISFTAHFIFVATPAILGYELITCIYGLIGIIILRYFFLLGMVLKVSQIRLSPAFIKEHLHLAIPLIISSLLNGSAQYIDGFVVTSFYSTDIFAVFRYGAKELPVVLLMANALSNVMLTQFGEPEKIQDTLNLIKVKSKRLMHFLFPLTIILLLISDKAYPLIFNESFGESATIFNVYLMLIISRLIFPHTILIGLKKTNVIMFISAFELAINVVLSIILIQAYGVIGVAYATFIAFWVEKIVSGVYNYKKLDIKPAQYIPIKTYMGYSVILLATYVYTIL